MIRSIVMILPIILAVFTDVQADTVYLKNGRAMEGIIKAEGEDSVDLEVFGGVVRFKKNEVDRIEKTGPEAADALRKKWEAKKIETLKKAREESLKREYEPRHVEISQSSGHIIVNARINKKTDCQLILDTGATYVVLSNAAAKKLGIDLGSKEVKNIQLLLADGRKADAKLVVLRTVSTQGVEAENVNAAILPEGAEGAGMKDGLLGMSFLKNFNFKIDQKNNKLILEKL